MRANIPRGTPRDTSLELGGVYLQVMQEISARLMENLPAGDRLWEILAQAETLLMEAQMTGTPPDDLFPKGGAAAFCQSIIDEYRAGEGSGNRSPVIPAARDKHTRTRRHRKEPRGDIHAKRYRRTTGLLSAAVLLMVLTAFLLYSGFFGYLIKGSAYYHDELHNFENTVMEPRAEPLVFDMELSEAHGLSYVLYADAEGYTISLSSVEHRERTAVEIGADGVQSGQKLTCWYITLQYTLDAGFLSIRAVSPTPTGQTVVTLADGTVYQCPLTSDRSGPLENGTEYITITVAELPADTDLNGATVTVTMDPPVFRVWKRVGMGKR